MGRVRRSQSSAEQLFLFPSLSRPREQDSDTNKQVEGRLLGFFIKKRATAPLGMQTHAILTPQTKWGMGLLLGGQIKS